MGTPTLYYYPTGGRALETVDLGEELTDLTAVPAIRREDAVALDGSMSTVVLGPLWTVRIVLERFGSPGASALERKLQALANHLRRGGLCGVALNSDKAWCGSQRGATGRGYPYVATGGNAFAPWASGATLVSGDEVAVEGAPPDFSHEVHGVSSMTGTGQVNLSESIIFDRVGGWTRHRDFWPVCYMSAEEAAKDPITHDHRRNYTLDLRLVFSPAMLATLLGSIGTGATAGAWTVGGATGSWSHFGVSHAKSPAFGDGSMLGGPTGSAGLGLVTTPTYSSNGRSLEELAGRKPMGPSR